MTKVLLFDANKIERHELEDQTSNERYQFAINELKTGICVSVMTLKAFQTLFNECVINSDDYLVYFYEL
jgi:hypothetical protein